ncbi:MAG: periplasmic heavy metal sensor [Mongoliitalea sp.]
MKIILTILIALVAMQGYAQDIFKETLYSADLVMANRELISLTDKQADKIKQIHNQQATEFRKLKLELDEANIKLKSMLTATKVDQVVVDRQMDAVLKLENQLKKKQFNTLVAIKNELNESQQAELAILKQVPTSATNLQGNAVVNVRSTGGQQGNSKVNIRSVGSQPSPNIVVSTSTENQPIYIIRQGKNEKKVSSIIELENSSINSVSVIKGSSAWELYGDEGKNGVVIVELKKEAKFNFE